MLRRLPIARYRAPRAGRAGAAQKPEDVSRVESAVVELSKLKRGSEGEVRCAPALGQAALGACRTKRRPGWARCARCATPRSGTRTRAAPRALERAERGRGRGAWVEVFDPPTYSASWGAFETPLSDPVLQAGIDAQRKRFAFNQGGLLVRQLRNLQRG